MYQQKLSLYIALLTALPLISCYSRNTLETTHQKDDNMNGETNYRIEQDPKLVRYVTKENGTEPAFRNAYWDNHHPGLYLDPYDGTVLFASLHKYDSKSGWPSFFKAINYNNIEQREDRNFGITRIEVRSRSSESHLGHLFRDGPLQTGKRYCINSAALRFIPVEDLEKEKLTDYAVLFSENFQEGTRGNPTFASAIFAGGCFWCTESAFEGLEGVMKVLSGYTGGSTSNPDYQDVSSGQTGHYEAIMLLYQPEVISYEKLVDIYWRHIDPTDNGGQFYDRGSQYHTAIFYRNDAERQIAAQSKARLLDSKIFGDEPIVTQILPEKTFYLAEDYHQDYYAKNPKKYQRYVEGSGRKYFFQSVWNETQTEE